MDLRQLRYFVTVADRKSISSAAAILHVAQSAISRQMRGLEEEVGGELFERSSSGVCLTQCGQLLLERARFILREVESAANDVSSFNREMHGTVRIAAPPSVARALYARAAENFRAQHPKVRLELSESPTDDVLRRLSAGLLDIGIISDAPNSGFLALTPFVQERLVLLCPPGSAPAEWARVEAPDLKELPIIISAGLRRTYVERFGELNPQIEIDGVGTAAELTCAGIGYAVLPYSTASTTGSLKGLHAVQIDGLLLSRYLALVRGRPVSLATRAFRAAIEDEAERCAAAGLFTLI
ncbi:LysR family transcriptional regulator [Cupriavidus alkaliphilus]|uniref:LysR family nitrogen assimilation transcriptional regulator n=1 Tax=Cupriavidus alkaliphilus TaxID=942866 RepID=A0A7W4YSS0_9BURK|nr:LysR family transcriptional regulator [Cupriavidus alkaliphilus]MBB3009928.1 LysR family nitrogen assimilation transcriptional regulator [Cupriavidus alkaliphilus]